MTTTDTDTLTERIRRARSLPAEWARLREGESTREQIERHQRRMDEQTAALVAEEVRKAKAEAWEVGFLRAHVLHAEYDARRDRHTPAIPISNPHRPTEHEEEQAND